MDKAYKRRFQKFSVSLSVQSRLQQRKYLNPEVFPYLIQKHLLDLYHSDGPRLGKSYLLISLHKSKSVPNSKEIRETFGNSGKQHFKTGQVCALVSGMDDMVLCQEKVEVKRELF